MATAQPILLDLNNPVFQAQLFALDVEEVLEVFSAFKKLKKIDWPMPHSTGAPLGGCRAHDGGAERLHDQEHPHHTEDACADLP